MFRRGREQAAIICLYCNFIELADAYVSLKPARLRLPHPSCSIAIPAVQCLSQSQASFQQLLATHTLYLPSSLHIVMSIRLPHSFKIPLIVLATCSSSEITKEQGRGSRRQKNNDGMPKTSSRTIRVS